MNKIKEYLKKIKVDNVNVGFQLPFLSLGIDLKKEDKIEILRELYAIRYKLSNLVFLEEATYELYISFNEVDLAPTKMLKPTINTYKEVASDLFSSKYFASLPHEQKSNLVKAFDFVTFKSVEMDIDDGNFVIDSEEIETMVKGLSDLFLNIDQEINKIEDIK